MYISNMWQVLFVTLPTQPNAARVRAWRALKALGSPALRDGAYVLPQEHAQLFDTIAEDIRANGGSATAMGLVPTSNHQQAEVQALFDRSAAYAAWDTDVRLLRRELTSLSEPQARRRLRALASAVDDLQRIDYYPGPAAEQARTALERLREAIDSHCSPGEPHVTKARAIERLDIREFQRKTWATRARPWVDRLASAWLISRFIDTNARFIWLVDAKRLPRAAVGFDFDGARFSHVGGRVTFEVLAASFGLDADPRLTRIAAAVHVLDVGGIPVPEAAGLEAVIAGLREQNADDDKLLAAVAAVFDAFYAAPAAEPTR